ncbi:MAG: DNA-directed RNA polymerase subunit P [Candidatus Nanohaloarchaea archaeon]
MSDEERKAGYRCVKCEEAVALDPVEDKIICPMCSHRVLLKLRSSDPTRVEAV